jgi:drug/metabolite transporter (DMT)-like permease
MAEAAPSAPHQRQTRLDRLAVLSLLVLCFLWGLNQVAAKLALPEVPALQQVAVRCVGGALLVWLWARWRGMALWERDGSLPGGLLAGALFAAEFACIFIGLQYTSASRMAVFIYLSPFVVALGMPFIAKSERLSGWQLAGLAAAFAGVASAFAEGFTQPAAGEQQWLGDALGMAAGVLWGATTLAIRGSALSHASAEKTLLYQLAIAGLALTAAALMQGAPWPRQLSAWVWASMLFQVVVVSAASYLFWFWLVRHYPATKLASFTLLTPVFGLAMGALLLGEPITWRLVLALATVAAGIVIVNRPARKA